MPFRNLLVHIALATFTIIACNLLSCRARTVHSSHQIFSKSTTQQYDKDAENTAQFWYEQSRKRLLSIGRPQEGSFRDAKNVIFFLGDGMGISTITAARIYKGQKRGNRGEEESLEFENFPYVSLSKTYALNKQVSDSANTATAYLCGVKANYATIGVNGNVKLEDCEAQKNKSNHVTSLLQWAQEAGKSTGFVTTMRVTHASPAGLYAHIASRDWENEAPNGCEDIAYQLINNQPGRNIQVIMGGGRRGFLPTKERDYKHRDKKGLRTDGRHLINNWMRDKERTSKTKPKFVWNKQQFDAINPQDTDYLLGLFEYNHMQYEVDRNPDEEPSIWEMTEKAINILNKNTNGFFLFVEGGNIDYAHHSNLAMIALEETVAMDKAVEVAVQMTDPLDTLILVTADHSHPLTINGYPERGNNILGISDVSDIDNLTYTTLLYISGPGYIEGRRENLTEKEVAHKNYTPRTVFPMKYANHGGEDVAVFAYGPKAYLFQGIHDQSYIPHAVSYAACMGPDKTLCGSSATVLKGTSWPNLILFICLTMFRLILLK